MQNFSTSPKAIIASLWLNRSLLRGLIHREIIGRYKGSFLGIFWSFFNPVLMLAVYTFFFSVVFRARWSGGSGSKAEFALVLFSGLLVFNFFSECISRAPGLVLANVNYVKKVIFPLELLPVVALGSAGFHLFISLLVWLGFYVIVFGIPHPDIVLLPLVLLPLALLTLGFSWCLAAVGVYLRDVSQVVVTLVPTLMFLSPIFYPLHILPAELQTVIRLSPITIAVEQAREVMYWGTAINWLRWGGYLAVSALIAWLGFAWFQKTRKGFADVI